MFFQRMISMIVRVVTFFVSDQTAIAKQKSLVAEQSAIDDTGGNLLSLHERLANVDRNDLVSRSMYLNELDRRLVLAGFVRLGKERTYVHQPYGNDEFVFSKEWTHRPVRIQGMMIETQVAISGIVRTSFRLKSQRGDYLYLTIIPGDSPTERRYWVEVSSFDSKRKDSFSGLMNRLKFVPGEYAIISGQIEEVYAELFRSL